MTLWKSDLNLSWTTLWTTLLVCRSSWISWCHAFTLCFRKFMSLEITLKTYLLAYCDQARRYMVKCQRWTSQRRKQHQSAGYKAWNRLPLKVSPASQVTKRFRHNICLSKWAAKNQHRAKKSRIFRANTPSSETRISRAFSKRTVQYFSCELGFCFYACEPGCKPVRVTK